MAKKVTLKKNGGSTKKKTVIKTNKSGGYTTTHYYNKPDKPRRKKKNSRRGANDPRRKLVIEDPNGNKVVYRNLSRKERAKIVDKFANTKYGTIVKAANGTIAGVTTAITAAEAAENTSEAEKLRMVKNMISDVMATMAKTDDPAKLDSMANVLNSFFESANKQKLNSGSGSNSNSSNGPNEWVVM